MSIPDMRLLHHWTWNGHRALHAYGVERKTEFWQSTLMELGFRNPFLLHGILALSAVHQSSFLPPADRQHLLLQANMHISQALDTMRKHLETPSDETSIPMFVLSSVLLTYNFGSAQERPDDPIGDLHHCFMLLAGIKVVVGSHWDKLKDSPILAEMLETSATKTLAALAEVAGDSRRPEITRLMELTDLVLDAQDKTECIDAITELHIISNLVRHVAPDRDETAFLFLWAAKVSKRFLELLAAHHPVACVITVHFAALLAQAKPVWWVVKWPRYLLSATEQLLAATPDLLAWLDWPQEVINSAPWTAAVTPRSI